MSDADHTPAVWQPIETAPRSGEPFIAASRLFWAETADLAYWQTDIWRFDDDEFSTDSDPGIEFEAYEIWCPIPPYPTMPPRLLFAAKQPPRDDNGSKGS